MAHFPIFLDLAGRRCLVIGGGEAAASRAASLARAGATVQCATGFAPEMLEGAALVFVAGASLALGERVAREARARNVPVNVMDEPLLCSFFMPAIVERGPVTVAVGTGGSAPLLARLLRQWLDAVLPARVGALASLAGRYRAQVKRRLPDPAARRRFWHALFTGDIARRALEGSDAEPALRAALAAAEGAAESRDRAA